MRPSYGHCSFQTDSAIGYTDHSRDFRKRAREKSKFLILSIILILFTCLNHSYRLLNNLKFVQISKKVTPFLLSERRKSVSFFDISSFGKHLEFLCIWHWQSQIHYLKSCSGKITTRVSDSHYYNLDVYNSHLVELFNKYYKYNS